MFFKNSFFCTILLTVLFCNGEAIRTCQLIRKGIAPVFTPFKRDGSLDLQVIPSYAAYLKNTGIANIWVLGTPAAEAVQLNIQESVQVLNSWLSYKNNFNIFVAVGYSTVLDSCKLAQYSEKVGIPAITYKIPTFGGAMTPSQAADDFKNVAYCAPNTPFYYYYDSSAILIGRNPNIGQVINLIIKTVPNFAGVIAPIEQILQVRAFNPNSQAQLIVTAYYSIRAAYNLNFDGFATPIMNIYSEEISEIENAISPSASLQAQKKLDSLATQLCSLRPDCRIFCPVNILKAGLQIKSNSLVRMEDTRRPLCHITDQDRADVAALFNAQQPKVIF